MEQAIKIAIENGYLDNYLPPHGKQNYIDGFEGDWRNMVLDREFWQALGKGLGWPTNNCRECGEPNGCRHGSPNPLRGWEYQWHIFIHHLAEGKDIDSFFTNLLK